MSPRLSDESKSTLRNILDEATAASNPTCASAVIQIRGASEKILFSYASGPVSTSRPIEKYRAETPSFEDRQCSIDDIFMLMSASKLFTVVAALQLVERNILDLDDPTVIDRFLPELNKKMVLVDYQGGHGKPGSSHQLTWEKRTSPITARKLMTNTAGLGYCLLDNKLFEYIGRDSSRSELGQWYQCLLSTPLVHQPGEKWQYGSGMDWVGILIERLTSRKLPDYIKQDICNPLGITQPKFRNHLSASERRRLLPLHTWTPDGICVLPPSRFAEEHDTPVTFPTGTQHIYSGGTGLCSSVPDYSTLCSALLNGGRSHRTGTSILRRSSVDMLFTPQLPPNFVSGILESAPSAPTRTHIDLNGTKNL